ncbi:MAG: molybdopterin cofactor-binding domain-containing protein [Actinomycetota bacterium]
MGERIPRREDAPLLTGEAKYVDDLAVPGALHVALLRSPHAHARIRSIDTSEAQSRPGVVGVLTGADLRDEWAGPLPCAWAVTEDMKNPAHFPVAVEKACYVGEAVAVVVADSKVAAKDALAAIEVDYEVLPAVIDLEDALSDRVVLHDDLGTNRAYTWDLKPDEAKVDEAFAGAAHVVKERYVQQRLVPSAMEPRGVCVVPAPYGGDYTVYSSTQVPHILKVMLGLTVGVAETKIRVIVPSVGGGFGSKLNVYAEEALCLALARRLRRPVRWTEERSENAQATTHGRGQIQEIELAADESGKVQAARVRLLADMGAYLQLVTPGVPLLGGFLYHGVYDIGAYSFSCTSVFTTKTPTDAYRGAGRPEASYAIERAMDTLARVMGLDPADIRRRNYIGPDRFPYETCAGLVYDSGNYALTLDRALELVDYEVLRKEQATRKQTGSTKHLGVGLSTYVEICGIGPSRVLAALRYGAGGWESATVALLPTGKAEVVTGTSPHGQGHETSWAQIVSDRFGIAVDDVDVLHSDTAVSPMGLDTYGSRSLAVGGAAVAMATDKVLAKALAIAAHQMEVGEDDLEFTNGSFSVKGSPDRTLPIQAVAFGAFTAHNLPDGMEPNLRAQVSFDPANFTFPFGTHACVVEVDEETGKVDLVKYVAVDDCGNQVNPMIVEGQVHGGVVQGVGQALFEEAVYDEDGNLLTSTLADYLVPSAAEVPGLTTDSTVTPTTSNPLGSKGVGEAGTIAAAQAVVNAIVDALTPFGVTDVRMPASPHRVWQAIQAAKERTA